MSYEDVIKKIKSGLSGDDEADIRYLKECIEQYSDHEECERIAGVCGQMIYERLPDSLKEEFSALNGSLRLGLDEYSSKAAKLLETGDKDSAEKVLKEGIALFEGSDIYLEKDGVRFYDFRKPMEEALFREEFGFEERIKLIPEPVVGLYRMYAGLLYEKGEHEKALEVLDKALKLNPYHQKTPVEYADNLREAGRLEDFKKRLCETFEYAYEPETLAACYSRLGWYFSEKENWEAAAVCELLAGRYQEDSEVMSGEKDYIIEKAGSGFEIPKSEDFERIALANGFPSEPDMYVIAIANTAAKEFEEAGNEAAAKYFYEIAEGLQG